jgi:hypothetical protein
MDWILGFGTPGVTTPEITEIRPPREELDSGPTSEQSWSRRIAFLAGVEAGIEST